MRPDEYILQVKEQFGTQYTKDGVLIRDMNDKALLKRMLERYPTDADGIIGLDAYLSADEQAQLPPPPQNETQGAIRRILNGLGQKDAQQVIAGRDKMVSAVKTAAQRFNDADVQGNGLGSIKENVQKTGALLEGALGTTSGAVQAIFAPFTATVLQGVEETGINPVEMFLKTQPGQAVEKWAQENPRAATNLMDAVNVGGAVAGSGPKSMLSTPIDDVGRGYIGVAKDAYKGLHDSVGKGAHALEAPLEKTKAALVAREVTGLENKYNELLTGTKTKNIRFDRAQKATGAKNAAGTVGQPPQKILAEAGIIPHQNGSRLETLAQADEFQRNVGPLARANRQALVEVERGTTPISLDDLEARALGVARSTDNINSGVAKDLAREIEAEFSALRENYGPTVRITSLDDIKSARWGQVKFDGTRPFRSDANYLIAKSAQEAIEEAASKAGFDDVAQLNRLIGDRLEAAKFLRSIDGQVVKGGRLQNLAYQTIGATFGNTIPGKIAGMLGGNMVANLLISNQIAGPLKRLILRSLETADPEAFLKAMSWLDEQGVLRNTRPLLEAGKGAGPILNNGKPIPVAPSGMNADFPKTELVVQSSKTGTPTPPAPAAPAAAMEVVGDISSDPKTMVMNHIVEAKEVVENLPKAQLDELGGMAALIDRAKTNIVDGLKAEGLADISTAIGAIDTSVIKTLDAFQKAVEKVLPK